MLSVEDRYYRLNRVMLKVIGLWPYQNSKWTFVHAVTITIIFLTAIFVQLAVFVTRKCTLNVLINVLSIVFPSIFTLLIYHFYYFSSDGFREVLQHIYYDWKSTKNKVELDILNDYASTAKLITDIFFFIFIIAASLSLLIHTIPLLLDVLLPLNESRVQELHLETEYFLDPSKYFFLFVVHVTIYMFLEMFVTLATGSSFYSYLLHACAVFKITNYRMEVMIDQDVLRILSPERERVILERLVYAVHLHRRNILYCDSMMLMLDKLFLIALIIGVTSMSISCFRLLQAVTMYHDIVELFVSTVLFGAQIVYMFFANHVGQQVTNNNAEIFDTVYNVQWYAVSLNIQKLVLFLLQKGTKNLYMSIGGMFTSSYEGFVTLITTAMSYFTVIYAIQ